MSGNEKQMDRETNHTDHPSHTQPPSIAIDHPGNIQSVNTSASCPGIDCVTPTKLSIHAKAFCNIANKRNNKLQRSNNDRKKSKFNRVRTTAASDRTTHATPPNANTNANNDTNASPVGSHTMISAVASALLPTPPYYRDKMPPNNPFFAGRGLYYGPSHSCSSVNPPLSLPYDTFSQPCPTRNPYYPYPSSSFSHSGYPTHGSSYSTNSYPPLPSSLPMPQPQPFHQAKSATYGVRRSPVNTFMSTSMTFPPSTVIMVPPQPASGDVEGLVRCLHHRRCTYHYTGSSDVLQQFRICHTCRAGNHDTYVCATCAISCHSNHVLSLPIMNCSGYCACGPGFCGSGHCKSLPQQIPSAHMSYSSFASGNVPSPSPAAPPAAHSASMTLPIPAATNICGEREKDKVKENESKNSSVSAEKCLNYIKKGRGINEKKENHSNENKDCVSAIEQNHEKSANNNLKYDSHPTPSSYRTINLHPPPSTLSNPIKPNSFAASPVKNPSTSHPTTPVSVFLSVPVPLSSVGKSINSPISASSFTAILKSEHEKQAREKEEKVQGFVERSTDDVEGGLGSHLPNGESTEGETDHPLPEGKQPLTTAVSAPICILPIDNANAPVCASAPITPSFTLSDPSHPLNQLRALMQPNSCTDPPPAAQAPTSSHTDLASPTARFHPPSTPFSVPSSSSSPLPDTIHTHSRTPLVALLEDCGCINMLSRLSVEDIHDVHTLSLCGSQQLIELGFNKLGSRIKVMKLLERYKNQQTAQIALQMQLQSNQDIIRPIPATINIDNPLVPSSLQLSQHTLAPTLIPAPTPPAKRREIDHNPNPIPPDHFICPISHILMRDPVMQGEYSYERNAIKKWVEQSDRSPMTNIPLGLKAQSLLPNHNLRTQIQEWRKTHPNYKG